MSDHRLEYLEMLLDSEMNDIEFRIDNDMQVSDEEVVKYSAWNSKLELLQKQIMTETVQ